MSLLPRYDEIIPTGEQHKGCSYNIQALMNNIDYTNYFDAECVTMTLVKVCPKCGKYRFLANIPVSVNNYTIQKYNIDVQNNIFIEQKQIMEIYLYCTAFGLLTSLTGTLQTITTAHFSNSSEIKSFCTEKEELNTTSVNALLTDKERMLNLPYEYTGSDDFGRGLFKYIEITEFDGRNVEIIYNKIAA